MKNMTTFQIVLISIFIVGIIGGMIAFAVVKGGNKKVVINVSVWGTLDAGIVNQYLKDFTTGNQQTIVPSYRQLQEQDFDEALVTAIADGNAPDIILVDQKSLFKNQSKLVTIPFTSFSSNSYNTAFIPEANLFSFSNGYLALPFAIDPMVMYWNRDIFTTARLAAPPKYWDDLISLVPAVTQRDTANNIIQSTVALGEYTNIDHAKDILSAMFLQSGNPIATLSGAYGSALSTSGSTPSADNILSFYTQFADPTNEVYSWNRSMPDSLNLFIQNKLGLYFGYASELGPIREKSPNLNFDVTYMPQLRPAIGSAGVNMTFGKLYGLGVLKTSKSVTNAVVAESAMVGAQSLSFWSQESGLPSVRRGVASPDPSNSADTIFYTSALWSRGWSDVNGQATEDIFKTMIESVTSGQTSADQAVNDANRRLGSL